MVHLVVFFVLALLEVCRGEVWVIIVSGSDGWTDYRHQSDICHAFQIANGWGVPADRIIVMQKDDIALHPKNPFPGQVFNAPTPNATAEGRDVYGGCPKDYTGSEVTAQNFQAILTGDASKVAAGKRVLQSGPEDDVFVNFVAHGGPGVLQFPFEYYNAFQLQYALKTARLAGLFKRLVFYVEACESGSLFDGFLSHELGVYAVTAATPYENSYGTFCPPDDRVEGIAMNTCLGDEFSVGWMDSAEIQGEEEKLEENFAGAVNATPSSHPQQYGDLKWKAEASIGEFLSFQTPATGETPAPGRMPRGGSWVEGDNHREERERHAPAPSRVAAPDIPLHLAYWRYKRASEGGDWDEVAETEREFLEELEKRRRADSIFRSLAQVLSAERSSHILSAPPPSFLLCGSCCVEVYDAFLRHCGAVSLDPYGRKYLRVLGNLCVDVQRNEGVDAESSAQRVSAELEKLCGEVGKDEVRRVEGTPQ